MEYQDVGAIATVIAAGVAVIAAVYTAVQAHAAQGANMLAQQANTLAQQSNRLALHEKRLRLYESIAQSRAEVVARGATVGDGVVLRLGSDARMCELFFPTHVSQAAEGLFALGLAMLTKVDEGDKAGATMLARTLRDNAQAVLDAMREHLRVGHI